MASAVNPNIIQVGQNVSKTALKGALEAAKVEIEALQEALLSAGGGGTSLTKFGVRADTPNVDQTTALQSAFSSGEPLYAPPGTYLHSGLTFPTSFILRGCGRSKSIFKLANGSNAHCFTSSGDDASNYTLSGFTIDGNKANQSQAKDGLYLDNTAAGANHIDNNMFGLQDPRNSIDDIFIKDTKGNGITQLGKGDSAFSRIWCVNNDGHGIDTGGFDNYWHMVSCGASGKNGINIRDTAGNNTFTNIKSWYSGVLDNTTHGHGIMVSGGGHRFAGVECQNMAKHGIFLNEAYRVTMTSVLCEYPSNPLNPTTGYALNVSGSTYCTIEGLMAYDRGAPATSMTHGIYIERSATPIVTQYIRVSGQVSNPVSGAYNKGSSQTYNNIFLDILGGFLVGSRVYTGWLPSYANDAAAASGGLGVGYLYINSSTGAVQMRLA